MALGWMRYTLLGWTPHSSRSAQEAMIDGTAMQIVLSSHSSRSRHAVAVPATKRTWVGGRASASVNASASMRAEPDP